MNTTEIIRKLSAMTADQRRDWYYLAQQAFEGVSEPCRTVAAAFGDSSPATCHVITTACYRDLSKSELKADADQAIRALQATANIPPESAAAVQQARNAELCPLLSLRTAKGMTQTELARRSGVNARQIRRIETGEAKIGNITLATAAALAEALGVEISDLLPAIEQK